MGFILKSSLNILLALILMFTGASCMELGTSEDYILDRTGIDIEELILVESTDTHGGVLFDGASLDVFECGTDMFEEIEGDWRPLPLPANLRQLVWGSYRDPQIEVPRIENGSYLYFDRHDEAVDPSDDGPLFDRASINISLLIYDRDRMRLYYYEYDT